MHYDFHLCYYIKVRTELVGGEMMIKIDLLKKTKPLSGEIVTSNFKNDYLGIEERLEHGITIPLENFETGLPWESYPTDTSFEFDSYVLNLDNPSELDGLDLNCDAFPNSQGSIYIGSAHNWCYPKTLKLTKVAKDLYKADCHIIIDFENEGVALNEEVSFCVELKFIR